MSSPAESSPMSFVGKSGRQYIVIASSGSIRPDAEVALIAFALPREGDAPVDLKPAPLPQPVSLPLAAPAALNAITRPEDLPAGPGRDDLVSACGRCHTLGAVTARARSLQEWSTQIAVMRQRGATVDDAAAVRIRDYLAAHFGVP
jgi:quinoprotein glucose dehydrogenase